MAAFSSRYRAHIALPLERRDLGLVKLLDQVQSSNDLLDEIIPQYGSNLI